MLPVSEVVHSRDSSTVTTNVTMVTCLARIRVCVVLVVEIWVLKFLKSNQLSFSFVEQAKLDQQRYPR